MERAAGGDDGACPHRHAVALPGDGVHAARRAFLDTDALRPGTDQHARTALGRIRQPRASGRLLRLRAAEAAGRARLAALGAAAHVPLHPNGAPAERHRALLEQLVARAHPGVLIVHAEPVEDRVRRALVLVAVHAQGAGARPLARTASGVR